MFFKTSLERDQTARIVLVEELALQQCQYYYENRSSTDSPFMGPPWMSSLIRTYLRQCGYKASNYTVGVIVHIADLVARNAIEHERNYVRRDDVLIKELTNMLVAGGEVVQLLAQEISELNPFDARRINILRILIQINCRMNEMAIVVDTVDGASSLIEEAEQCIDSDQDATCVHNMRKSLEEAVSERPSTLLLSHNVDET